MKILYNAPLNKDSDATETHIAHSLEKLGHIVVSEGDADIYLFHKQYNPPQDFTGIKVCYYFDKVWHDRVGWMEDILKKVDAVFLSDETYVREHNHPKLHVLRQGIGESSDYVGENKHLYNGVKIAFTGSIYGERTQWYKQLKERYGEAFCRYDSVFNDELKDMCAEIPIFLAPLFPTDEYYCSNRIYLTLGSGGFMIHPRTKALVDDYVENEHYVGYEDMHELFQKIDYYLVQHEERKRIQKQGYEYTINHITYTKRCENMLSTLRNIGMIE